VSSESGIIDISTLPSHALLALHGKIASELRFRGVTRTLNNPVGDLAEYLFCKAFGWKQENNSNARIDAVDSEGVRYQIKGRRISPGNKSRQMGAIRDLAGEHFEFLAGVLFSEDFGILRAAIIPCSVVVERSSYVTNTNSHRFLLHDDVWNAPGVRDVTVELRKIIVG
jgi:hypothetical protein